MGVGLIVGGSLLAVACGALNGSWVVPTKANAPKVLLFNLCNVLVLVP